MTGRKKDVAFATWLMVVVVVATIVGLVGGAITASLQDLTAVQAGGQR